MIKPTCDRCGDELLEFGGLAFSPPFSSVPMEVPRGWTSKKPEDCPVNQVTKYHLCAACWKCFVCWVQTYEG